MRPNVRIGWLVKTADRDRTADRTVRIWKMLHRMLEQNVGKPWNDVHSALCKAYHKDTWVGSYIRDQIRIKTESTITWRYYVDGGGILREIQRDKGPWRLLFGNPNEIRRYGRTFLKKDGNWFEYVMRPRKELWRDVGGETYVMLVDHACLRSLSKEEIDFFIRRVPSEEIVHREGHGRPKKPRKHTLRDFRNAPQAKLRHVDTGIPRMDWAVPTMWGTPVR